jgi:hypothetical protein
MAKPNAANHIWANFIKSPQELTDASIGKVGKFTLEPTHFQISKMQEVGTIHFRAMGVAQRSE